MLTQAQFNSLLIPVIYHHFEVGQSRVPSLRRRLFNVQQSEISEEKGTGMGGMSPDAWNVYKSSGEPGVKGRLDFTELYTQSYIHEEYPVEVVIQKKLVLNDQYGKIEDIIRRVGISAEQKMEIDAASLLNNAFNTSVTWSDGKRLCAADHPKGPHTSGSYSNRGTTALSAAAVSATRTLMMRFKDDRGNDIGVMPNELWVPPELEDTAIEVAQSLMSPGDANTAINAQAGRWTVIPWLRLSDSNNWFMVDGTWRGEVVNWYEREATQIMLVAENTTELVYEFKLHYSFGVDDWRWIYGHEVA
ncbi:MAG: hypothetical protein BroJett033_7950 [Chloroflexota bacterium]|nr:MAG: hypothetical protein BroJett033_7950 [Chloroflexota bacterium]